MSAAVTTLDDLLTSPSFFPDPYPVYAWLREQAPVHWSEAWGVWVLTRYADVVSILRDARHYSNAGRFNIFLEKLPSEVQDAMGDLKRSYSVGMLQSDPPDHTRLRALVNKAFTPRAVERMRPRIQILVDNLLDRVQPHGHMDILHDFAYQVPAIVIAEMLGVPTEDRERFTEWSDDIAGFQAKGRAVLDTARRAQQSMRQMENYFRDLFLLRRSEPQDDLMTALVQAEEQGDKLNEGELLSACTTLLVAGHETTRNLIGNGMLALLQHPAAFEKLKNSPALLTPAVEELLRFNSPLQRGWRRVAEDVEIEGHCIHTGQLVFGMIGSANRDPSVFADPDRLDLTRQPNPHIAFGFGVHFCVGAPLARLEGAIAIETLLRRMPYMKLATDQIIWQENSLIRGLKNLPVVF
jgi:cytochrome P450